MTNFKALTFLAAALALASPARAGTATSDSPNNTNVAVVSRVTSAASTGLGHRNVLMECASSDADCLGVTDPSSPSGSQSDSPRDAADHPFVLEEHENSSKVWSEPGALAPAGRAQSMSAK